MTVLADAPPTPYKYVDPFNKMLPILFTVVLAGGVFFGYVIHARLARNAAIAELANKFSQASPEMKARYQLDGTSLKETVKNDPKDRIEVTIGDTSTGLLGGTSNFNPKVKIARWDDEVNLSLTPKALSLVATKDKTLDLSNGKIKMGTPSVDYQIYDIATTTDNPEGGLEYEVDLKSKPASNVVQFQLDTKGVNFYYQPPLNDGSNLGNRVVSCTETDCYDKNGVSIIHRPENVVGSYAVYVSEQKTNWEGGKLYRAGKVGHIFRPKIIDSAGTAVWGDLLIKDGILSVTIPQDFLDKAVYPVRHAAGLTFGFTAQGNARTYNINVEVLTKGRTGVAGTVTSITAYCYAYSGSYLGYFKGNILTALGGGGSFLGDTAEGTTSATPDWYTRNYTSGPNVSANTDYWVGVIFANYTYWLVDSGWASGDGALKYSLTYGTWNNNPTSSASKYSVYATYSEASSAPTASPSRTLRLFNGFTLRIRPGSELIIRPN